MDFEDHRVFLGRIEVCRTHDPGLALHAIGCCGPDFLDRGEITDRGHIVIETREPPHITALDHGDIARIGRGRHICGDSAIARDGKARAGIRAANVFTAKA